MNKNLFDARLEARSFQKFGFSRQVKHVTTLVEVLLLLAYGLGMILSVPLLFI